MKIEPRRIVGNWMTGYALDLHTSSSTAVGENAYGHMQFDSVRTPIAELLYQLKYRHDPKAVSQIVTAALGFISEKNWSLDVVVPVPASSQRALQPVIEIARGLAAGLGIPFINCVKATRATPQLKNIVDLYERQQMMIGLYTCPTKQIKGKNVLLVDDLYRSGTTLNAVAEVLRSEGEAQNIKVLTVTQTRSNR